MKFLLTSAGLTSKTLVMALEDLLGKPLSEASVLFIITAANTGHDDKSWMIKNICEFEQYNFKSINVLDFAGLPSEVWQPHFDCADVICFGGGDERYLARSLEAAGIKEYLLSVLETKVFMGISAGSMVAGRLLPAQLNRALFVEEDFGNDVGEGMELLPFSFVPHLNSTFFSLREERLEGMKEQFPNPVYALDDFTALAVFDGVVTKVGDGVSLYYKMSGNTTPREGK